MHIRVTRTARHHRVSVAHIRYVIEHNEPSHEGDALHYLGNDARGVELEIVVIPDDRRPGAFAVIHAMPTQYRR